MAFSGKVDDGAGLVCGQQLADQHGVANVALHFSTRDLEDVMTPRVHLRGYDLDGGPDGMAVLAPLIEEAAMALKPGGHLFRRHPLTALAGLYSLFSLAGVPGTPGARLWLEVARGLAAHGHSGLLVAFALGWLAAFTAALRQLRAGFGAPVAWRPEAGVPAYLRAALWVSGAGLALLGAAGALAR